jgi:glycosyltransferase involved in cell wall biosynthesis
MARIYLDARAPSGGMSGVDRYCRDLIPELAAQAPQHEFTVIRSRDASEPRLSLLGNLREVAIGGGRGALPLLMSRPQLRGLFRAIGPPDVYHSLFHLLPFGVRRGRTAPKRVVVTLHDLIWIDYARQVERTALAAAWRRRLALTAIPYALRAADHIICNSEATARSADRWVRRDRCTAIHMGVSQEFFALRTGSETDDGCKPERPYIAAFGVPKAYKNIRCLVQAFATLAQTWPAPRLVLIGGNGNAGRDIQRAGLSERVIVLRDVRDPELRDVIRRAEVLVVPSIVEGFGLPVAEAMALGTPVVVSNTPALCEVAGNAAQAFEASNPTELAELLTKVLGDERLRAEMAARGRLRSSQFTWAHAAKRTLAVYENLLGLDCAVATESPHA